jgi:MFS family permease
VLLLVVQGDRLAHRMLTWPDETGYLHLGYLAASGRISLYQDEIVATRMPLPFYVLGMTQMIWGRSLLAARFAAIAFSVGALILAAVIARRLGGERAGLLAAAFFATQGVLVGYLATATYYSFSALILLAGLALLFGPRSLPMDLLATAVLSLLILTRTNLWAIPPVLLVVALHRARTWVGRLTLVAAATAMPLAFFLWDPRHLKVFAYLPVLGRLVEPLGYRSTLALTAFQPFPLRDWPLAMLRLARMYEFWMLALAVLAGALVLAAVRGRSPSELRRNRPLLLLAAFFAYVSISQVIVFLDRLKQYVAYFPSWAPILAILLGVGYSALLSRPGESSWTRRGIIATLAISLTAPVFVVRHPLLPSGAERGLVASERLEAAVHHVEHVIPPNARVFLWGNSMILYLAGRDPYLQQIYSNDTLAAVEDRGVIPTHGLWGLGEIETWLSVDADYAVVQTSLLEQYRATRTAQIERIQTLLSEHFIRVDRIEEYPWFVFDVYARRVTPRG